MGNCAKPFGIFATGRRGGVYLTNGQLALGDLRTKPPQIYWQEKHPSDRKPHSSTLEVYEETPVFIPVDIKEDVFKSVTQKLSGRAGPGCMDLEAYMGG